MTDSAKLLELLDRLEDGETVSLSRKHGELAAVVTKDTEHSRQTSRVAVSSADVARMDGPGIVWIWHELLTECRQAADAAAVARGLNQKRFPSHG